MINNRQNGRRRGRGGNQRPGGGGGGGQGQRDSGNRIDSRARGNAAQLLEKYRNMARDAQMSGDRVNTEYYLQFADHYFRVLADQRGRSDDQQPPRRLRDDFDQFDDGDDFGDEGEPIRAEEQMRVSESDTRPRRDESQRDGQRESGQRDGGQRDGGPREGRQQRDDRPREGRMRDDRARGDERPRGEDRPREARNGHAERAEPRFERETADVAAPAPTVEAAAADDVAEVRTPRRRTRKPREEAVAEPAGFDVDRLPPALGATVAVSDAAQPAPAPESAEEAPKPRRRRVRPAVEATPAE